MIKNWLIKVKQIKKGSNGFINHTNYLKCNNRAAHEKTNIVVLEDNSNNILKEIDNRTLYRQKNSLTGGGVRNYASSFVISLPNNIKQPSTEEWRKIALYGIKQVAKANNIDFDKLRKISHIVLHNEDRSENKHNHVHILIGNVLDNKVIKGISQFKSIHAMKEATNYSVLRLLKEDNKKYIPINKKTKDKPLHVARAEKMERILFKFDNFKNSLNKWIDTVFKKQNDFKLKNLSLKAAHNFNTLDNEIGDQLGDKLLKQVENIEELEMPKQLKEDNKVSPKTNRKRRRRKLN